MSEQIIAGPQALNSFVDYQAGAVVSKEVLRTPAGTVTLFAFDEGQGLSEHTAPFDVLVQIVDGEADIMIAGQTYAVKAGEMIKMPAGKPHALQAKKQFKMMLIMLKNPPAPPSA
ncbi:MAG TPA: cupin domain-containing protein [Rhodospirillaceae bacterium]|nr:cupin domain-containing protein [Rhodospirillaceae bacterium]